jgi:hypothetical protein
MQGTPYIFANRSQQRKRPLGIVHGMAVENPGWGYTHIQSALYNLGYDVGGGRLTVGWDFGHYGRAPAEGPRLTNRRREAAAPRRLRLWADLPGI